jgi:hypothetical protein
MRPLPMLPWAGFFACAFPNAPVVLSYLSPITYLTERPKCAPAPGVGESIHERIGLTPWTISGSQNGLGLTPAVIQREDTASYLRYARLATTPC